MWYCYNFRGKGEQDDLRITLARYICSNIKHLKLRVKMNSFKVIIVEDVPLELKGTEGILRNDIPEAEIIGTADSEIAYWHLIKEQLLKFGIA